MSFCSQIEGHLLCPDGWRYGSMRWAHGIIEAISGEARPTPGRSAEIRLEAGASFSCDGDIAGFPAGLPAGLPPDAGLPDGRGEPGGEARYILPGFIDLHVHGGGGRDVMEGGDALATIAQLHARHGTTSLLATTMTAPGAAIRHALHAIAATLRRQEQEAAQEAGTDTETPGAPGAQGASILGVHLEGPFINPQQLGAQPDMTRAGAEPAALLAEIAGYHTIAPLRVLTLAPEVLHHTALIEPLRRMGIVVQIGHSKGSYEEGVTALAAGARSFTHLYNAMSGLHHRQPGMVGAALAHAQFAELIPDLLHVHPGAMRAALRAIPRLYCVTDATAATGMPDGAYPLGGQTVHKCLGGVRLADGTLAGSVLTLDTALRNLVRIGLPVADASRRLSAYPAALLDLQDRGQLLPGQRADLVVLNRHLQLQQVYVGGRPVYG